MSFQALPTTGGQVNVTMKIDDAGINDNDLGKPVVLHATDTVALAVAGEEIYGFINSIEVGTEGGKSIVGVCIRGRARVTLEGDIALGSIVEAGTIAAAGAAKVGNWAAVVIHVPDITTATTLRDSTFIKNWVLISGAGTDTTDGVVESM